MPNGAMLVFTGDTGHDRAVLEAELHYWQTEHCYADLFEHDSRKQECERMIATVEQRLAQLEQAA